MVKYREILRLRALGAGMRNISFSCKCSKTTVKNVIDRAKATGLEWPLPEEMGDEAIRTVLFPAKPAGSAAKAEIDHARIDEEMDRPGVTMMVLWSEYCETALASGKEPYMYSAFCQKHREWAQASKAVMHIERKPAQEMQVDYVGDTMEVLDVDAGEILKSHKIEQQSYRSCRGVLALSGKHGKQTLEQACAKALAYSARPSYKTIKSIAAGMEASKPEDPDEGAYLRGSEYYHGLEDESPEEGGDE